jgi:hypothetical protein
MEILRLLDQISWIASYEVQDFRRWEDGFYYRAPHHRHIMTFPHHKHTPEGIFENLEIALPDVLEEIGKQFHPASSQ